MAEEPEIGGLACRRLEIVRRRPGLGKRPRLRGDIATRLDNTDPARDVIARTAVDLIRCGILTLREDVIFSRAGSNVVATVAAYQGVGARAALELIGAPPADEQVPIALSEQHVAATRSTDDDVVSSGAEEGVRTGPALRIIAAFCGFAAVVARPAPQGVVADASVQRIVARSPRESVVTRTTIERDRDSKIVPGSDEVVARPGTHLNVEREAEATNELWTLIGAAGTRLKRRRSIEDLVRREAGRGELEQVGLAEHVPNRERVLRKSDVRGIRRGRTEAGRSECCNREQCARHPSHVPTLTAQAIRMLKLARARAARSEQLVLFP